MMFGMEKTRMVWLPGGEKKFEDIFIRLRATHERDGQTDGQKLHDGIYRAYAYASRGKNRLHNLT